MVEGQRQMAKIAGEAGRAFLIGAVCPVEQELHRLFRREHAERDGGGAAFPIREARGDEHLRARARQKPVQRFRLLHIVVEEEPGLFEAAIRDEFQRRARGFGAIFRLLQARNEDRAQRHEPVHDAGLGVRAEPPRARIALAVLESVLDGERGFADAAEALHGGLGDDGGLAVPERAVERGQILAPPREVRHLADAVVQHGFRRYEKRARRNSWRVLLSTACSTISRRRLALSRSGNEIPIGERREQATRNAFRDPHHDQPPALVQRIMADGAERLGHAVIALEIGWRKKGDDARAAVERGLHALHEITVRKIPVLQGDAIARAFEDAADHCGKMRIRAGPRNKEMRFPVIR